MITLSPGKALFRIMLLLGGFAVAIPISGNAQVALRGIVTNQSTGEPVGAAHVFINYSSIGTLTDENGAFSLSGLPHNTNLPLVVSHLSFETYSTFINTMETGELQLDISLDPRALDLKTVEITARKGRKHKRWLRQFEQAFLGNLDNARKTVLKNPEVLRFSQRQDGMLEASATDMLKIRNEALGYELNFLLEKFALIEDQVSYGGKPWFIELIPEDEKQLAEWKENRKKTYQGSLTHFLHSLVNGSLEEDGFYIYRAARNQSDGFTVLGEVKGSDLLSYNQPNNVYFFNIPGFLKVEYTRETDNRAWANISQRYVSAGPAGNNRGIRIRESEVGNQSQISFLYGMSNRIVLDPDGHLLKPEQLVEFGYMADERIADLLPYNYSSIVNRIPEAQMVIQDIPIKNGFLLADLKIPLEEIHSGGPPKDGIPSIDNPTFVAANKAGFMQGGDLVLGVKYNGIVKAYPIKILNWHEVVNDEFKGESVVVTYCPLCGSGMAFQAEIGGRSYSFGVSGLLYNSDVLLYDRQTESLWSQIKASAVSGDASGKNLTYIPTIFTTWQKWTEDFPGTLVLSTETGHDRNYSINAYADYDRNPELMFPVSNRDDRLPVKAEVLGMTLDGKSKAWPLVELKKDTGQTIDHWQGLTLIINYDKKSGSAVIKNREGRIMESVRMYWFAWYAFHPETEIYRAK